MTCPWIWVFGHKFLDFPQCPKYIKTGVNQPSNCICILVRLHLMWNVEFNTLDGWLSVYWCPWFGTFGPNFPDLPQFSKNTNTGITKLSVGLYLWARFHLMQNFEFNTMDEFLCIHALYLFFFLDLPQFPNTIKQV